MVANLFDRPMFQGQQPMMPEDDGSRIQPKSSSIESDAGVISYPQSRITAPLGGDGSGIMEALAMTANQVDPAVYQAAMRELVPTRSTADIAAEYDRLYADEPAEAPNYGFEKNLALARAGLALMQPTMGGALSPSIAKAGDSFVQDLAAIKGRERKDQATFLAEQKAAGFKWYNLPECRVVTEGLPAITIDSVKGKRVCYKLALTRDGAK